jgi:transposase-like protein
MRPLEQLCCQNSQCPQYGKRGAGNLTACGWIDRKHTIRQLYCRTCKARFSERKGTVLYHAKLPPEKVVALLEHVREGCGVRQTARLVQVDKDTANRYVRLAGEHAAAVHDELVAFSPSDPGSPVR